MNDDWLPWIDYPGLTLDRLLTVGDLIRKAREGAAEDHHPEKHETNWSLGVSSYERTCGAITMATTKHLWLRVVAGANGGPVHFVMSITVHPVRFYPGEPDDVPARYQQPSLPEVIELERALALSAGTPQGSCLRIAIPRTHDGRPDKIFLVEMDQETMGVRRMYLIPRMARTMTVTDFAPPIPPVDIPPVTAEPIENEDQTKKDNQSDKTGSDDE